MRQDEYNPLTDLEASLASLQPRSSLDRDVLMYEAGCAAAERTAQSAKRKANWLWPLATAASLMLSAVFGGLWALEDEQSAPLIVAHEALPEESDVIKDDQQQPPKPTPPKSLPTYLELRQTVLTEGVQAFDRQPQERGSQKVKEEVWNAHRIPPSLLDGWQPSSS